jgi:hypothetical protein
MLQGMTLSQSAICVHLVLIMLESERPIARDYRRLARLFYTKVQTVERTVEELLDAGKMTVVDGGLWCDLADKELTNRRQKSAKAQTSVGERWEKTKQKQRTTDTDALLQVGRQIDSRDDQQDRPFAPPSAYEESRRSTVDDEGEPDAFAPAPSPSGRFSQKMDDEIPF